MFRFPSPRGSRHLLGCLALALAFPAQAWTDKPVKVIVSAPVGGAFDQVARLLSDQLSKDIGQPFIVENRPGAGGVIGIQALVSAPPDGNTIMVGASTLITEVPHVLPASMALMPKLRPVAVAARDVMLLVGAPNLPPKDLAGLIAYVKTLPGQVSFASYSAGTSSHYAGMILNQKAGLDMQHIPFPGIPPGLAQVMGGQIPLMFASASATKQLIASGKVQAYAVAAKSRSPQLPQVPTFAEQGVADFDFSNWLGVMTAAALPDAMVQKINNAVNKAVNTPALRDRFLAAGFEVNLKELEPDELARAVKIESDRNAAIVKAFDIKL